jgi:DNA helicase-2/ATP-dependent DNA helicase PcrA
MSLTTQQQTVLNHIEGHLVVLAGPGSGKTHTLIEKIFHIFDQQIIPEPYGLLAITFSNAAVTEIKTRLRRKNFRHWDRVQVQTFHGFANYMLRCYGSDVGVHEDFSIIDRKPQARLYPYAGRKKAGKVS